MKRLIIASAFVLTLSLLFSCVEKKTKNQLQTPPPKEVKKRVKGKKGVWHTVEPGQTLWRICKTYGVDMEEVARINGIKDPSQIKAGQKIFIPGADKVKKVPASFVPSSSTASKPKPKPSSYHPRTSSSKKLLWPVPGGILYSPFGPRGNEFHEGIDISAPVGTPVLAADDGKVVYSDNRIRGYGNMIIIKHSGNLSTVYAHNRVNLVREGEFVRRGQKIAEVGKTGRATGPHLHFEVRVGKEPVNPLKYLEKPKTNHTRYAKQK